MMMFYFDRGLVLAMLVNIWYTTKSHVRYEMYCTHILTLIEILHHMKLKRIKKFKKKYYAKCATILPF